MRLLTGDECGLIKECIPELSRKEEDKDVPITPYGSMTTVASKDGVSIVESKKSIQARALGVIDMCYVQSTVMSKNDDNPYSSSSSSFASLRQNGSIDIYQGSATQGPTKFGTYTKVYSTGTNTNIFFSSDGENNDGNQMMTNQEHVNGNGKTSNMNKINSSSSSSSKHVRPLGLAFLPKYGNKLCAADMMGNIVVIDYQKEIENSTNSSSSSSSSTGGNMIIQPQPQEQHRHLFNAYASSTSKNGKTKKNTMITYTPGKMINTQVATAFACDTVHGRVAMGGRERETTLLDINSGKVLFKAKNLPPDPQTLLQQPVWPTSILFLNNNNNNNDGFNSNASSAMTTMAVGTAYKQVRIYDVRESSTVRRPTSTTSDNLFEYRITALCQVDEYHLAVGDAAGYIYNLDMRKLVRNPKKMSSSSSSSNDNQNDMGRYVGPAGSIRQLKKHPTLPRMAVVGLDRMLRIYDTDAQRRRQQLDCIYLKQRVNCVLFSTDDELEQNDVDYLRKGGTASGAIAIQRQRRREKLRSNGINDDDDDENSSYDSSDIDQEDLVQDYIDSDEEDDDDDDGDEDDADDQNRQMDEKDEDNNSQSDDNDDDDDDDSEDDGDDDGDNDDDDGNDDDEKLLKKSLTKNTNNSKKRSSSNDESEDDDEDESEEGDDGDIKENSNDDSDDEDEDDDDEDDDDDESSSSEEEEEEVVVIKAPKKRRRKR